MPKQLIFIDDSGDPGFKSTSSKDLVMAAAVFISPQTADALSLAISAYGQSLGRRKGTEFKFSKDKKEIIVKLLKIANQYDFEIYAVYLDKKHFEKFVPIIDNNKLYDWTIGELLCNIPIKDAKIKIDGRSSKQKMLQTASYLRNRISSNNKVKIEIKFEDSRNNNLIQLVDLIAGSINRSLQNDKTDSALYIKIIKNKIKLLKDVSL